MLHTMSQTAEACAARSLRSIFEGLPVGADAPPSEALNDALVGLEFFLPAVLAEIYPDWHNESLDGIYPHYVRKAGPLEAEIFGLCDLMSAKATTALRVRLQFHPTADEITWLECRLGEMGADGMVRTHHQSDAATSRRLAALQRRGDDVEWSYRVTFGERRVD
jgi:hypothetical protein